jgi:type IV pilus assembly protein PilN
MIRINLLPIKQDRRREAGRIQFYIGLAVLLVEASVCFWIHTSLGAEVDEQDNKNISVKAEVDNIKRGIQDRKTIVAEIAQYEKRQAAIESLKDARVGPVYVMLELSKIMSLGGSPQIDNTRYQEMLKTDPTAGYEEGWDYRRLWIDQFSENARKVKITGQGLTHEDVAEFLKRVSLSDFFVSSKLISTDLSVPTIKSKSLGKTKIDPVVHFKLEGEVRYR